MERIVVIGETADVLGVSIATLGSCGKAGRAVAADAAVEAEASAAVTRAARPEPVVVWPRALAAVVASTPPAASSDDWP
jgi:hypothetical protein